MSAYSVPRSIPPTQGTVPVLIYYPNTPSLNPEKLRLVLDLVRLFCRQHLHTNHTKNRIRLDGFGFRTGWKNIASKGPIETKGRS